MQRSLLSAFVAVLLLGVAQPLHALFIIDSFNSNQYVEVSGPPSGYLTNFNSLAATDVVGGWRDVFLERTSTNAGFVIFDVNYSSNGLASLAQGLDTKGRALVHWDHNSGTNIVYNGLGGVDGTQGGTNKYLFTTCGSDLGGVTAKFTFYSDSTNFSFATVTVLANTLTNRMNIWIPLSSGFTIGGGTGADFTKIGAVTMLIDGTPTPDADTLIGEVWLVEVPEPSSAMLGLLGVCALALRRRRCRS